MVSKELSRFFLRSLPSLLNPSLCVFSSLRFLLFSLETRLRREGAREKKRQPVAKTSYKQQTYGKSSTAADTVVALPDGIVNEQK